MYIHTYIHTYLPTYRQINIHTSIHPFICTYISMCSGMLICGAFNRSQSWKAPWKRP